MEDAGPELRTLDDVLALIDRIAGQLDPTSRYIPELQAVVASASDLAGLAAALDRGCRGKTHAGDEAFSRMSLEEKILANLVTPETHWFRFTPEEMAALRGRGGRVLIVPCSHGKEAYSVASLCAATEILALDRQPALIEVARSRTDVPPEAATASETRITFQVGDAFQLPPDLGRFDVVLCRNFLGHFRAEAAVRCAEGLADRVAPAGTLFLDAFCVEKLPELVTALGACGFAQLPDLPAFQRA